MSVWQVEIFADGADTEPVRRGHIKAPTEDAAAAIAVNVLGDDARIEITRAVVRPEIEKAMKDGFTPH